MRGLLRSYPWAFPAVTLTAAAVLVIVAAILTMQRFSERPTANEPTGSSEPSAAVTPSGSAEVTPRSSASASASAETAPSAGETPGAEPSAVPSTTGARPRIAISLVDGLRVREQPGTGGAVVGALQTGDVADVYDGPQDVEGSDWYAINGHDGVYGWVSAGTTDRRFLDLRFGLPVLWPATVRGIAAGPDGFVAWGDAARRSDVDARPMILSSADGAVWRQVRLPTETVGRIVSGAWGPAGWLLVTTNTANTAASMFWRSADALTWAPLPAFAKPGIVPWRLHASADGYLLSVRDDGSGTSAFTVFSSADGESWQEESAGPADSGSFGVTAFPGGYLGWSTDVDKTSFAISTDNGAHWSPMGNDLPGSANNEPLLAVAGSRVFAVVSDWQTGAQTIWRRSLDASGSAWTRASSAEAAVAGSALVGLVSDGASLVAVGYRIDTAEPRTWASSDGSTWTDVSADGLFGGIVPDTMAAGPDGFAAVGHLVTTAGINPVLWHSPDGSDWQAEASPAAGVVASALASSCPALPTTMVDWLMIPSSVAVECFGDAPITFRGWSTEGGGCGGYWVGSYLPGWLASPFAEFGLILTPYPAPYGGCGSAAPATSLPAQQQWVNVTGHYDDPASPSCHWLPDPSAVAWPPDPQEVVLRCRQVFVATEVVPTP